MILQKYEICIFCKSTKMKLYKKQSFTHNFYTNAIKNGETLHIVERHTDNGPIICDLDFRYNDENILENKIRQHKKEHIKNFIKIYIDEICNMFEMNDNYKEDNLKAFVFERKKPYL